MHMKFFIVKFTVTELFKHCKQECIPVGCLPPARWLYLPACSAPGDVPGPRGVYLVRGVPGLGGCTWSGGNGYLVPGRCTWSGGGCTWSGGVYLVWGMYLVWGCIWSGGGCTWSGGGVPGPKGVYLVWGVYLVQGVYLIRGGCTWSGGCTWWGTAPRGQNHRRL